MSGHNTNTIYLYGDSLEELARNTVNEDTFAQLLKFRKNPRNFIAFLQQLSGEQLFHLSEQFNENQFDQLYDKFTDEQKKALSRYECSLVKTKTELLEQTQETNTTLENTVSSLITELHTDETTGLKNKKSLDYYVTERINAFFGEVAGFLKEKQQTRGFQKQAFITEETPLTQIFQNCGTDFGKYQSEQNFEKNVILAFGDLDGFKYVNDTYGHVAGDKVLKITAETLEMVAQKASNRYGAIIKAYRFGGDEFVLIGEGNTSNALQQYLRRETRTELDNPENYQDIDEDLKENARVGISVGFTDSLSFNGLCETMKEYVENNYSTIRVKDINEHREAITDSLRKKINNTLYQKAEEEAEKDKNRFYLEAKELQLTHPEALTKRQKYVLSNARYADRLK